MARRPHLVDTVTTPRFVAYYRVSTARQGASGLGLEAQQEAVTRHVSSIAGASIVAGFTEIESGKVDSRPELTAALAACRATRAVLLVAKLDRLSRNLAFLANLMEAEVDFLCCDNPHATPFTLHILAAVAEHERKMISSRTRAALAAARARGVKLGNPHLTPGNSAAAAKARACRAAEARTRADELAGYIRQAQRAGAGSLREIAAAMEARGIRSPSGRIRWHAATVRAVLALATPAVPLQLAA